MCTLKRSLIYLPEIPCANFASVDSWSCSSRSAVDGSSGNWAVRMTDDFDLTGSNFESTTRRANHNVVPSNGVVACDRANGARVRPVGDL